MREKTVQQIMTAIEHVYMLPETAILDDETMTEVGNPETKAQRERLKKRRMSQKAGNNRQSDFKRDMGSYMYRQQQLMAD